MRDLPKMVVCASATSDQLSAFMRESVETMPLEVLATAWNDQYARTSESSSMASDRRLSLEEKIPLMIDALRNISFMLVLAEEIRRRGRDRIAMDGGVK